MNEAHSQRGVNRVGGELGAVQETPPGGVSSPSVYIHTKASMSCTFPTFSPRYVSVQMCSGK